MLQRRSWQRWACCWQASRLTELSVRVDCLTELPACIAAYQGLKKLCLHFSPRFVNPDPDGPFVAQLELLVDSDTDPVHP